MGEGRNESLLMCISLVVLLSTSGKKNGFNWTCLEIFGSWKESMDWRKDGKTVSVRTSSAADARESLFSALLLQKRYRKVVGFTLLGF
jgi:hypothetical protein